ncbi:PHA/PHB synthase family protein [Hwanghaeella sp.]|uniref:PHA/PHB synthase family protein n=1 Tax=Hwanghaeella sp. TaxID=2605943 RepID=UPI003CCBF3DE
MARSTAHGGKIHPIDRFLHAAEARATAGLSPASIMAAYLDWVVHLANSPGKQAELVEKAVRKNLRFAAFAQQALLGRKVEPCIEPLPQDRRFQSPDWQTIPFSCWYQAFLLTQQWWYNATVGIGGVTPHHEDVVSFLARQILDMFSPSNFPLTNPTVLRRTLDERGMNLVRGAQNFLEDWERSVLQRPPVGTEAFRVGGNVAVTKGKVVYRNRLIELIQYEPTTKKVGTEPVLIVPAWIMKYYILDLSPANSMVKYLVDQGHTVFMISWKNPTEDDSDLGFRDYLDLGVTEALQAVRGIVGEIPVHTVGYCIGGTLLSIATAAICRDRKDWIKSMTLFAAQTDFTEAGELMLFIDDSQIAYLEDLMWDRGYLDTKEMAGAFQLLRSNDLIWSKLIKDYLMGERSQMSDLMAWNADATRMPYRMHSEYLRSLFLNNDFAEGRYTVDDKPVALTDIHVPVFVVGAERDHVAPWKSVFKINLLSDTDITFLLTSGGHNAGIISEPGHPHRHYRMVEKKERDLYVAPDHWYEQAPVSEGSWWPAWQAWLTRWTSGSVEARVTGNAEAGYPALCDAPGSYVLGE